MNLQTLTSIVGPINRGRLDSGFNAEADERSTVKLQDKAMVDHSRGWRVVPPPIDEDLSHLEAKKQMKPKLELEEKLRRVHPERRRFYRLIYERGVTVNDLAEASGIVESVVQKAFSGFATQRTRTLVGKHLTDAERKELGWE